MKGRDKCKILKEIRKEIAKNNDIEYVTSECKYSGECTGTCPKCEEEVKYLESEIEKRKKLGKKVAVAGITAASIVSLGSMTACNIPFLNKFGIGSNQLTGDVPYIPEENSEENNDDIDLEDIELIGDVVYTPDELDGDIDVE